MKEEYLSASFEPAHRDGGFKADPSEKTAAKTDARQSAGRLSADEIAAIRDSVFSERAISSRQHRKASCGERPYLGEWIEKKRAECSVAGNLSVAFLAAILGGPFAILGAFMAGTRGWYGLLYVVVFAPVVEEFLKQSGMIYLLERKPYRVFAAWQFVFSALVSALIFATIENLLYLHVYVRPATIVYSRAFVQFRWTVCTAVHLGCSAIASLGMIQVWKKQLADGKAADLSAAFGYFAVAIVVHGLYNLLAIFLSRLFFE